MLTAAVTGAVAAVRAAQWLRGSRWRELLTPPAVTGPERRPPRGTVRAALLTLRLLALLPRSPWRYTCLYRSVACCLILRRYGTPAVVRIGVKREGGTDAVLAHAWVETPRQADRGAPDSMQPFPIPA